MEVVIPKTTPRYDDCTRVKLEFQDSDESDYSKEVENFKAPLFLLDSVHYVLVQDLAKIWNYPSSYQVLNRLIKSSSLQKQDFLKSSKSVNQKLKENGLIADETISYFYVEVAKLFKVIKNKESLIIDEETDDISIHRHVKDTEYEDKITISQIFPSYGFINNNIELKHSTFNCLTNLSKFNFYKNINRLHYLGPTKMTASELEELYNLNDYNKLEMKSESVKQDLQRRKPLGKPRKTIANVDVNNLELNLQNVLPGQGYIHEFNINHVCKIPNYYITNSNSTPPPAPNNSSLFNANFLNLPKKSDSKVSRNVAQLVFNNDYESFNYNKYFYTKTYRGPGSGNYKDASLVNRINKIPTTNKVYKKHIGTTTKRLRQRAHLKGLMHEAFHQDYVNYIVQTHRNTVTDPDNIEVLHNTLQFNLLINTYRDMSHDTWLNYYKFKQIDFEKLTEDKWREASQGKPDNSQYLLNRFNLPTDYKEIMRHLPVEFRDSVQTPLYFNLQYLNPNNSQFLNNVDIIKLPNANTIGWDNIKKYRDV